MRANKHLLLWSSLGVLLLLITAAAEENVFKEWRKIQHAARTETGKLDVHLRQIVVPSLRTADRCVSCHAGMAAGESGLTGGRVVQPHPPVVHDPSELGCTTCHAGQGRATEKADAHGDVLHWPEPMIPLGYAEAGCGSCHTHLKVPHLDQLREGLAAFERNDCLACHRLDGRGGTLRPGGAGGMEGPDLSLAGATGYDREWYEKHLERREASGEGVWKSTFGILDESDRAALEVLLSSRFRATKLLEAKALFHSLGCRGCHRVGGVGGDDGPDLTHAGELDPGRLGFEHVPGERSVAGWLAEHFRSPQAVVPGSQMPVLGLSEEQIDGLVLYMLSLRRSDVPEAWWPRDRIQAERFGDREFATDGATLYGTFCAACHGPAGQGMRYPGMAAFPAIGNPDFLALVTDEFIAENVRRGRPGRRMPAWGEKEGGLRPAEIDSVTAFVRRMGGVPAPAPEEKPRWIAAARDPGASLYAAWCAGCHGNNGEGFEGPALNNAVLLGAATDTYLLETTARGRRGTSMEGFAQPSTVRPALTSQEMESIVAFMRTWGDLP